MMTSGRIRYDPGSGYLIVRNPGADRRHRIAEKFYEEMKRGNYLAGWTRSFLDDVIGQRDAPFRMHHWRLSECSHEIFCHRCGFSFTFTTWDLQSFMIDNSTVACLRCGRPVIRDGGPV